MFLIYRREYEFFLPESITFNQSALRRFYQSALRHEQLEDACSRGIQWEWLVIVFCSDLLVKRCEGDCVWIGLGLVKVCKSVISVSFLSSLAYFAEFLNEEKSLLQELVE